MDMEELNAERVLDEAALKKKQIFEEKLQKQEQERKTQKEQKKMISEITKDPKETMHHIQTEFKDKYDEISQATEKFDPNTQKVEDLFAKLNSLKDYYVSACYALNAYDKQQYKESLDKLEISLHDLQQKVQPKKKFAFSKKPAASAKQSNSEGLNPKETNGKKEEKDYTEELPGVQSKKSENIKLAQEDIKPAMKINGNYDCTISIDGFLDCLYIKNNEKCKIYVGPASSSVFVDNCVDCEIVVMAHQIRIHNSKRVDFKIFSSSKSIIEHCEGLRFFRYNYDYKGFESDFEKSGLKNKENLWSEIQDFNWLKQEKSPNFAVITD